MAPRSCYDILGVAPDVPPDELRSAYIRLMKDHHPDRAGTASARAGDINRAFAILRDPVERAAHDHELARARRTAGQAALRRAQGLAIIPANRRPQRRGRRLGAAFILIVLTGVGALTLHRPDLAERLLRQHVASAVSLPVLNARPAAPGPQRPFVAAGNVTAAIVDFDVITTTAGPDEAESYSRQCFRELAELPSLRLFDHCVAFDTLVSLWQSTQTDRFPPRPFFEPAMRDQRWDAGRRRLALGEPGASLRIAEIERVTLAETAVRLPMAHRGI